MAVILGAFSEFFSNTQQARLKAQTELAAQGVEHEGISYFDGYSFNNLRVTLVNEDGSVLYDSESNVKDMESHADREEIREALADGYGESSRYSSTLVQRRIYSAQLLSDGTVLRLSSSHLTILSLLVVMLQPIVLVVIIAVAVSFVLAARLSDKIVKPLIGLNLDDSSGKAEYEELRPLLDSLDNTEKEKSEKMRREFTANVSHELKTPLQSISGYAELLKNGMVREEDTGRFLDTIYAESQRMIALVEDIIGLSRLDEGNFDEEREEIDLYMLAEKTLRILEPSAKDRNISLSLSGESASVTGISELLESMLYNLTDNAIKYNRESGSVSIRIENTAEAAVLSVSDTGIGIPEEDRERIFERFYRVDKSHSKALGGTGLGLSIVKHAAKLHNANVELDSIIDGGTTITVTFPKEKQIK